MTKQCSADADRWPDLFVCDPYNAEQDRFSILDGVVTNACSRRRGTRWLGAVLAGGAVVGIGVGGVVLTSGLVTSAVMYMGAFGSLATGGLPTLSPTPVLDTTRQQGADALQRGRSAVMPGGVGPARIISAASDEYRFAGPAVALASPAPIAVDVPPSQALDPHAAPPHARAQAQPDARGASAAPSNGTGAALPPRRSERAAKPGNRARDPDVDIIAAIVAHAGRRR